MSEESRVGRVIVTYGRSIISLMIAQSLGSRGIEIIGCDDVNMTVLSFSKFVTSHHVYTSPSDDEAAFIEDLLQIVEDNRPDDGRPYVLIPAFNDAKIIARHKQRFADKITVACPDYEMIDQVNPKDHFAKTAAELNVASPQTWMPVDEQELQRQLEEIEFPVFIKPPDDVGGRGISRVENADQLMVAYRDLVERYPDEQILIQGLAEGVDYCFCGLFDQGELKAQMVYHNLQKFPVEAGPGVVRETVASERFAEQVQRLMKPLKWNGVAEIDFMWDEKDDSTPLMIEVNPRFWAGLDHSIKSDVDFPYLLYRLFVDGEVETDSEAEVGKKTRLPGLSTLARIEELVNNAFNFDDLEAQWPQIKQHWRERDIGKAAEQLRDALQGSVTLDEAMRTFRVMLRQAKEAQSIAYHEDDPFIGLGVLFVLGSLIRHGKLPPEMTR
ncbi:MAG: hypothetical protein Tsb002_28840 [Wenzhouxiangellaceae bacterium]